MYSLASFASEYLQWMTLVLCIVGVCSSSGYTCS